MDQVTVAGSGVLGSQIAFQCAYKGCDVRIYDIDPAAVARLSQKWRELSAAYRKDLKADDVALAAAVGRDRILPKRSKGRIWSLRPCPRAWR
jgi:3-hydroxybutyryl-CoA dehydrogenase